MFENGFVAEKKRNSWSKIDLFSFFFVKIYKSKFFVKLTCMVIKDRNFFFCQNSIFFLKSKFLTNRNLCQKSKFLSNRNFCQLEICQIESYVKNRNFCQIEIFVKSKFLSNRNFCQLEICQIEIIATRWRLM